MNVLIHGAGVAASCCAHLLRQQDIAVEWNAAELSARPVVMLSDPALTLIRDLFGQPDLFADRPRIDRRIVAWGTAAPTDMPHAATIVSGAELHAALAPGAARSRAAPDFTIHAASPLPHGTSRPFGTRTALATQARLLDPQDAATCHIESLDTGWLFLIPSGDDRAWLLCVGAPLATALAQSRLIAPRIAIAADEPQQFDPNPRLATDTGGPGWLACGTAAIAFDPICGDGTAQAVREAILAAAVVAGIRDGGDADALTAHYDAMLIATMRRHLQLCAPFYRSGGTGPWWRAAHDALAQGHDWCSARLATQPAPRYTLVGDRLVEREPLA